MWVVFLLSGMIIAGAALVIWFVGNEIYIFIRRRNRKYELEEKAYGEIEKSIREGVNHER